MTENAPTFSIPDMSDVRQYKRTTGTSMSFKATDHVHGCL